MAKVVFEFDDTEESSDIEMVVSRHKLAHAAWMLSELYRTIYNGKIYDPEDCIYVKADGCKATQEDYDKANLEGKYLEGGKTYLKREFVEFELDKILDPIRHLIF